MLKLLIVEDEMWEREGLVDFVDWHALGIEMAGTACDGVEGMEAARRIQPDIIITDIKMPIMDGLKMTSRIRTFLPNVHVVVLTGYDDFKLAQEAIGCGADAYILKPVVEDEFIQVICQAAKKCRREKETLSAARTKQLLDVLEGRITSEELIHHPYVKNIMDSVAFMVLSIQYEKGMGTFEPDELTANDHSPGSVTVEAAVGSSGDILVILRCNDTTDDHVIALEDRAADIFHRMDGYTDAVVGAGSVVWDAASLAQSCMEARRSSAYGVFWGLRGMIRYQTLCDQRKLFEDGIKMFYVQGNTHSDEIHHALEACDKESLQERLTSMFTFLEQFRGADRELIANFLHKLMSETWIQLFSSKSEKDEIFQMEGLLDNRVFGYNSFHAMKSYIYRFFEQALDCLQKKKTNMKSYLVSTVLNLAETQYMQNINLRTVASEMFVSPNYLGALFKGHTGQTFNDYLNGIRMRKARELLGSPENKVQYVAERVGIPNVSYFCAVFKKTFGTSPGEFQQMTMR